MPTALTAKVGDITSDSLVRVGTIGKPVGLKGEAYLISTTDIPDVRFVASNTLSLSDGNTLEIKNVRKHNERYILCYTNYITREDVENLHGCDVFAPKISEDDDSSFYYDDLVGLSVRLADTGSEGGGGTNTSTNANESNATTNEIGKVLSIITNSAQDLLEISHTLPDGTRKKSLIPFVESIVPEVDVAAGYITIDPPVGLLEL